MGPELKIAPRSPFPANPPTAPAMPGMIALFISSSRLM
jgi:hypothetical protein